MAENVPEVVVPPLPARKPVDQALAWIGFDTEGNYNRICNKGGMEAFDNFVGLNESNIRDVAFGFSRRNTTEGHINFGMWRVKYNLGIMQ